MRASHRTVTRDEDEPSEGNEEQYQPVAGRSSRPATIGVGKDKRESTKLRPGDWMCEWGLAARLAACPAGQQLSWPAGPARPEKHQKNLKYRKTQTSETSGSRPTRRRSGGRRVHQPPPRGGAAIGDGGSASAGSGTSIPDSRAYTWGWCTLLPPRRWRVGWVPDVSDVCDLRYFRFF